MTHTMLKEFIIYLERMDVHTVKSHLLCFQLMEIPLFMLGKNWEWGRKTILKTIFYSVNYAVGRMQESGALLLVALRA